jgi:pyrroloquinoline-quinone synthase
VFVRGGGGRAVHVAGLCGLRVQDTSASPELQALLVLHTLPPYLQPSVVARAKKHGFADLELVQGYVGDQCKRVADRDGKFDVVQISNITDWMSPTSAEELLCEVKGSLNDGGAVVCRRLNGDYKLENVVGKRFLIDPYLNHGLKAGDRSFFYSEVVVGFHERAASAATSAASETNADHTISAQMAASAALPEARLNGWLSAPVVQSLREVTGSTDSSRLLRPSPACLEALHLSSADTFDAAVSRVCRGYDFNNHPYIAWMLDPTTTRQQFTQTQLPFKFAVERFSQPLAMIVARLERTPDRLNIVDNLCEEHGLFPGGRSHVGTFAEFLTALGASADDIKSVAPPVHVHAFNESLLGHCAIRSPEAGAAAIGMIEALYVNISDSISKTILRRKWVLPGSQSHYAVHAELDIRHAKELLGA